MLTRNKQSSKLAKLAEILSAENSAAEAAQPPKANTSLLWDLLDYASSSSAYSTSGDALGGVELDISTQFLSPLTNSTYRAAASSAGQPESNEEDDTLPMTWEDGAFEFDNFAFPDTEDMTLFGLAKGHW